MKKDKTAKHLDLTCCRYWEDYIQEWETIDISWKFGFRKKDQGETIIIQKSKLSNEITSQVQSKIEMLDKPFNGARSTTYLTNLYLELRKDFFRINKKEISARVLYSELPEQLRTNLDDLVSNSEDALGFGVKLSLLKNLVKKNFGELKNNYDILIPSLLAKAYFCRYLYNQLLSIVDNHSGRKMVDHARENFIDIISDYFSDHDQNQLSEILIGFSNTQPKLQFCGAANQLGSAFNELYENNLIIGVTKKELMNWIEDNFTYKTLNRVSNFSNSSLEAAFYRKGVKCMNPIFKVLEGVIHRV